MTEGPFLEPQDLVALTGKRLGQAQRRVLNQMGVTHKVRPDGKIIVHADHLRKILDAEARSAQKQRIEPNWSAL
jgi:hypothetical protein